MLEFIFGLSRFSFGNIFERFWFVLQIIDGFISIHCVASVWSMCLEVGLKSTFFFSVFFPVTSKLLILPHMSLISSSSFCLLGSKYQTKKTTEKHSNYR